MSVRAQLLVITAIVGCAVPSWAAPNTYGEMRAFGKLAARLAKTKPLKGMHVLGHQHLEGATQGLSAALVEAGVEPGHISLLGKTYSENPETVRALLQRGIHTDEWTHEVKADLHERGESLERPTF